MPLTVTVDRYYGTARPEVKWHDDGPDARAGVVFDLLVGQAARQVVDDTRRIDEAEEPTTTLSFGSLAIPVEIFRATTASGRCTGPVYRRTGPLSPHRILSVE